MSKAICKIMKNPASAAALMRYLYRQRKADVGKKSEVLSIVLGSRGGDVLLVGDYAADALALAARKGRSGSGVRHIVISAESNRGDVVARLKQAAKDWMNRYAPGRAWVAVVHTSTRGHPHVHLVTENRGDDRRGLKWSRKDLRGMCGMTFTTQFEASRPPANPRPHRSKVYPHAVDLDAAQLVRLIVSSGMDADGYVVATGLGLGKVDGNGVPFSVLYSGRRIRLSTLRRLHRVALQRQRDEARAAELMINVPGNAMPRVGRLLTQLDDVANCTNKRPQGRFL